MGRLWSSSEVEAGPSRAEPRLFDTPLPGPLGPQLKGLFDGLCDGPMPSRLLDLADALEEAFQRGELHAQPCEHKSRPRP